MTPTNQKERKISKLRIFIKKITSIEYTPRYTRLAGDLESYKPQLEKRIAETQSEKAHWAERARELLQKSQEFLNALKIDEGWKAFHTAKRLEINAMNDHERIALGRELLLESTKLNNWRMKTIQKILGDLETENPLAPSPQVLTRAAEIKDEHYNNQYYKNALSRNMFRLLFALLLVFFTGIILYFWILVGQYEQDFGTRVELSGYIIGVLLFGFLGAITSAILFTRYNSQFSRITEISSNSVITLSKVFVGAAFSVFIFLLLKSSLLQGIQIFTFSVKDPLDYFAIAFVSGFSERLAQNAIEAIVGKEN